MWPRTKSPREHCPSATHRPPQTVAAPDSTHDTPEDTFLAQRRRRHRRRRGVGHTGSHAAAASFEFKIASPGCILAQIRPWTATTKDGTSARRLDLAILGADREQPRQALTNSSSAVSPLWVSYAVFSGEAARVPSWTIRVTNPDGRGTARGIIKIEYPPTQMPCALTARASRPSGVDLTWRHSGRPFSGSFLVERSTDNGKTWGPVSTCTLAVSNNAAYECRDESATVTPQLLYRACAVTSGNVCAGSTVTPAVRVSMVP